MNREPQSTVNPELIKASKEPTGKTEEYYIEKTPSYSLSSKKLISVYEGHIAKVYLKFDNPRTVTKCTEKKLMKALKLRGDRNGEDFFVIFESKLTEQNNGAVPHTWGVGSVPVKHKYGEYHVGTKGMVRIKLIDSKKFIDAAKQGQPGIYTSIDVLALVTRIVEQKAEDILGAMFKNVNTFLQDAVYLTDEYNLRLESYFSSSEEPFEKYGIKLLEVKANTISVRRDDVSAEKERLSDLAAQEEKDRQDAEQRKKIKEAAERRKAAEAARRKAEEEALLEQKKKLEDAKKAENAAERAKTAADEALKSATEYIELAKKSEQDAIERAKAAEKRVKELELLLKAYKAAKAAARSVPGAEPTAKTKAIPPKAPSPTQKTDETDTENS